MKSLNIIIWIFIWKVKSSINYFNFQSTIERRKQNINELMKKNYSVYSFYKAITGLKIDYYF